MNVPRMVRKYAQDAHTRYMRALENVREMVTDRPGDFTGDRFTEFCAARAQYDIYNEPLALDAVGNTAFPDGKVVERIRAERTHAHRWLLTTHPDGGGIHSIMHKIKEDETRRFLSNTAFVDLEDEEEQETGTGGLVALAKDMPADRKVELIKAMGFQPIGSDHTADCPYAVDPGLICQCVPPATQWAQPRDVDELRGETWEQRREQATNGPARRIPAAER